MIEEFFKAHQHTVAAIAAAGTLAAVLTSLTLAYFVRRADRTKLTATGGLWSFTDPSRRDVESWPQYLQVKITNDGRFPLRIPVPFFYWKLPFKRGLMLVAHPLDFSGHNLIRQKHYPCEIAPRTSESFTLSDLPALKRDVSKRRGENPSLADRIRFRFIRAYVFTDDGAKFRVKFAPGVRRHWLGEP